MKIIDREAPRIRQYAICDGAGLVRRIYTGTEIQAQLSPGQWAADVGGVVVIENGTQRVVMPGDIIDRAAGSVTAGDGLAKIDARLRPEGAR